MNGASNKMEKGDGSTEAYRGPKLPKVPEDLVVSGVLDLDCDERLWVPQAKDVWFRPLCFNVSHGYFVNILRVRKSGILSRHRHTGPVHATVLRGRWHYLEHDWWAEEGGYAFEPPGDIHTLEVPEGVNEMVTLFHVTGAYIYVDRDGVALGIEDVFSKLQAARKHYEEVGLGADFADQFVRSSVPTLQGSRNYQHWRLLLRTTLNVKHPQLWQVASGEYALESYEPIVLTPAEIRTKTAAHFHVSDETAVNDEQIAQWTKEFIDTPNEKLIEWQKLNALALYFIKMTIHPHIGHSIQRDADAPSVMKRLHFEYDTLPKGPYPVRYNNYISHTYKVGMDPTSFCCKFRDLLADMDDIVAERHKISPMQAYCQFMAAVRAYDNDMLPWLISQSAKSLDVDPDHLLDKAIQSFLNHEHNRNHNRRNA